MSSYYSDFNFTFTEETTSDVKIVENEDSINQSIKNILLTNRGEVFFNPLFGSGIQQLLFEKITPITEYLLKSEIKHALGNFEPRISINNIDIYSDYDSLEYSISIDYIINKLNTLGSVDLVLELKGI